jgi:hypothetical protein
MRAKTMMVTALLVATPITWGIVDACGDKFLLVGRGMRFQRAYAAVQPANILIYATSATNPNRAIRDPQFQKTLRQAGHQVSVIEDAELFRHAIQVSAFDIVLADVATAPAIDPVIASAPSHPRVLYVEYPSGSSKALAAQFACELKADDRVTRFLDRIGVEMKARAPQPGATK